MNITRLWRLPLVFLVTLLAWEGLYAERAMALSIQDACSALQNDQALQDQLGVRNVKWIPAGASDVTYLSGKPVPLSHCYVLTEARGKASYNPNGSIAAVTGHFPAVEILRVPECYNGSSVLNIFVGGGSDQTGFQELLPAFHQFQFLGASGLSGLECRAFAFSKNFPNGGSPFCVANPDKCPVELADHSYSSQDWALNTLALGHRTRELLMIFGGVTTQVGFGLSIGGMGAISLIGEEGAGNPFTATGIRAGAGGLWNVSEEDRKICMSPDPKKIPLLGTELSDSDCTNEGMANDIAAADPEFAQSILDLSQSDPDAAKAQLNTYNVSDRPNKVQKDVDKLKAGGNLQVPLIIVQGTGDKMYFPHNAILAWREIIRSTKTSMARLYFLKGLTQGLNHSLGPPQLAAATNHMEFFKAAVNWAETGNAPGPLMIIGAGITTPIPAPNCTDLGFEPEPCKCWDFIVNSTTPALRCVAPDGVDKY
jgi:hypothetical protein